MHRRGLAAVLVLLHAAVGGAASPDDPLAGPRAEFRQAWSQPGSPTSGVTGDSASLQAYVLYPYLEAARLQRSLTDAAQNVAAPLDQAVEAFLRAHDSEPVAHELRRAWLGSLAARGRWEEFLAFHRPAVDDATLRCHGFTARIELGRDTDLAAPVTQAWLTPRSLLECDRAFTWLSDTGALTPALIEQRVRAALTAGNAGFARQIVARLPAERAAPLLQWAALLDNPQREIDALIAGPRAPVEPAALLAGWTKLARANRAAARQRFERLVRARHMDHREASPFALALGLALSWDRDPEALKFFARVEPGDYDDTAREWHARAALWAGDWKLASRNIAAMSEGSRRSARWRYWAARVAALEGQEAAARALYESILTEDNYYSAMAAARLKRPIAPNPQGVTVDPAVLEAFEARPAFVRARELLSVGLEDQARLEWSLGHSQLPASARPQTIQLAVRWGWYHQAVAVATGERVFNDYTLLYPRPYDTEVAAAAKLSGLPPTLIYSVIRQESLFQRDAVSSADARGLMQLLPATARTTARAWKLPAPSPTDLFEPATNVMLGAAHVKELLDRYGGQLPLALAGYNAGPAAVQRWLPADAMDPDIWIENIPYNETRNYVQRIHWHSVVFGWLASGEAQDTQGWLRPVRP